MASSTQRLSLDPKLWAKTRREAFDRGMSASALVAEALALWFDQPRESGGKLRGYPAMKEEPSAEFHVGPAPARSAYLTDLAPGNATIDLPDWDPAAATSFTDVPPPADWSPVEGFDPPVDRADGFGIPVDVRDEIDDVVAKVAPIKAEFRPVPKPAARKRPSRTRS